MAVLVVLRRTRPNKIQVEPPGGKADHHRDARIPARVGGAGVPQAAVAHGNRTGLPDELCLTREAPHRVSVLGSVARVVRQAVASRHDVGGAIVGTEIAQHPERGQMQRHVRIWRWNVRRKTLIVGPIRMPPRPLSAGRRYKSGEEGNPIARSEGCVNNAAKAFLDQIGRQRLVEPQQVADLAPSDRRGIFGRLTVVMAHDIGADTVTDAADLRGRDHVIDVAISAFVQLIHGGHLFDFHDGGRFYGSWANFPKPRYFDQSRRRSGAAWNSIRSGTAGRWPGGTPASAVESSRVRRRAGPPTRVRPTDHQDSFPDRQPLCCAPVDVLPRDHRYLGEKAIATPCWPVVVKRSEPQRRGDGR